MIPASAAWISGMTSCGSRSPARLKQNKLVIPVLVGRARMPSPADLPEDLAALARRNAVEISHQRFNYDVQKLVSAIKNAVPANPSIKRAANSEISQPQGRRAQGAAR